jgi:hypothetical protein
MIFLKGSRSLPYLTKILKFISILCRVFFHHQQSQNTNVSFPCRRSTLEENDGKNIDKNSRGGIW